MADQKTKVWEKNGEMFHDECFEESESREGYEPVDLNTLDGDETCESCDGPFLAGPDADVDYDEDEEDEIDDDDDAPATPEQTA